MSWKTGNPMSPLSHDYVEIANNLKIPSLATCRDYHDLVFLYKILRNYTSASTLLANINLYVPPRNLRGSSSMSFYVAIKPGDLNYRSVVDRSCILYNKMSNSTDLFFVSFGEFKRLLRDEILVYS